MSDDDAEIDFFKSQMQGVTPIKVERTVVLDKGLSDKLNAQKRRTAAQAVLEKDKNFLSGEYIEPVEPLAVIEFKRDGVQTGVFKSMKAGKYAIDARLDLHHMTIDQARSAVYQFIHDCMNYDIRFALVTHGKGEGRGETAQIKSCVAHWLPQFPEVLAFHSAQRHHGWVGATYVLLKKSDAQPSTRRDPAPTR